MSDLWFGKKNDKDEVTLLIYCTEGSGENLFREDRDEGYVDYINYDTYRFDAHTGSCIDDDGGMILLKSFADELTTEQIRTLLLAELEIEELCVMPDMSEVLGRDF